MRVIEVKKDQSLFDIAIQEYGDITGVFDIVEDNELKGITDNVYQGDKLKIKDKIINNAMVNHLSTELIATVKGVRGDGIGYLIIGVDNIIS
jgi:hypothetical protein